MPTIVIPNAVRNPAPSLRLTFVILIPQTREKNPGSALFRECRDNSFVILSPTKDPALSLVCPFP